MTGSGGGPPAGIAAVLLLGPTGSGKTPLGGAMERSGWNGRRCAHFDFGAELRRAGTVPEDFPDLEAEERAVIRRVLTEGALLDDRHFPIAAKILARFLERTGAEPRSLVILNGLPRHLGQARALEAVLEIVLVVRLEAPAEILRDRIRRNAAGDRSGRIDDSPAEIGKKLALFAERTKPLAGYYAARGVPAVDLAVSAGSTGETLRRDLIGLRPNPA